MKRTAGLAVLAFLPAESSSNAQVVVRQEPFDRQMLPGSIVLVDDGTRGKGKIKGMTGGVGVMNPRPPARRVIKHPASVFYDEELAVEHGSVCDAEPGWRRLG